jgi:hypothetical protein
MPDKILLFSNLLAEENIRFRFPGALFNATRNGDY